MTFSYVFLTCYALYSPCIDEEIDGIWFQDLMLSFKKGCLHLQGRCTKWYISHWNIWCHFIVQWYVSHWNMMLDVLSCFFFWITLCFTYNNCKRLSKFMLALICFGRYCCSLRTDMYTCQHGVQSGTGCMKIWPSTLFLMGFNACNNHTLKKLIHSSTTYFTFVGTVEFSLAYLECIV